MMKKLIWKEPKKGFKKNKQIENGKRMNIDKIFRQSNNLKSQVLICFSTLH